MGQSANNNGNAEHNDYESRVVQDRMGNRRYTLNTLVDQVIEQFVQESFGRQDILAELAEVNQQLAMITEITDYVLAMDYISLAPQEKSWLVDKVHQDLFRFGPLETYLKDETVTEISINDYDEIYIQRGFAERERIPDAVFDHPADLIQLVGRVLAPYGFEIGQSNPFIEAGIFLNGRHVRLSLVGPPMMPTMTGQIRLHPARPLHLQDMATLVPPVAAELLTQIVRAGHGLMIAGEVGVGKTSILGALLPYCPPGETALVERAREISAQHLPETTRILTDSRQRFAQVLAQAVEASILFVDEIQGDEGQGFWPVLQSETLQQVVACFRGKAHPLRLQSAFTMGIRKAFQQVPQADINARLLERFPFVLGLEIPPGSVTPRLAFLGQWQTASASFNLEPLVAWEGDTLQRTGIPPCRAL